MLSKTAEIATGNSKLVMLYNNSIGLNGLAALKH